MASRMIGRATCPECGFHAAHVKETEKCIHRYCPECNAQYFAKSDRQRADLLKKTKLLDATPSGTEPSAPPTATEPSATTGSATPTATPAPPPAPAPKRRGLFA